MTNSIEDSSASLVMEKGYRNKPLTKQQNEHWLVEQTFGGWLASFTVK
ncbi:MAG: hypothetical protein OXC61_04415 [Flavobacteriaceae bacterium]|nr:hypothetical protein [Flavobacteriaceae bacterium]